MSDDVFVAVDLFCGAGGFSEGLKQACDDLDLDLRLSAVNHWDTAVESHNENHDALTFNSKVQQLHPPNIIRELLDTDGHPVTDDEIDVDLIIAGPECTHHSNARGGRPVKEQRRMSPWHVLDYIQKLDPTYVIVENVGELTSWGPVISGEPVKDGSIYERWVDVIASLGYSVTTTESNPDVDGYRLNTADYGDPTDRDRFFLIASQEGVPEFPEPTHDNTDPSKPDKRTAAECIDWTDLGTSIWSRDLTTSGVTPPAETTMSRIAEGVRRHCPPAFEPFADALDRINPDVLRNLREQAVPLSLAPRVATTVDEPFLVALPNEIQPPTPADDDSADTTFMLRQQSGAHPIDVIDRTVPTIATGGGHQLTTIQSKPLIKPRNRPYGGPHSNTLYDVTDRPTHTVTAKNHCGHLVMPTLGHFSHGGRVLDIDRPLPTIATERGGAYALQAPSLTPLYNSRTNQRPRNRDINRPLMTIPASKTPAGLMTPQICPFIDDYENGSLSLSDPLNTVTSKDKFALVVPQLGLWGLDVKYRMLKTEELKRAQGLDDSYTLCGTKTQRTEQLGNAVPANTAREIVKSTLTSTQPDLRSFGGGMETTESPSVPDYFDMIDELKTEG